MERKTIGLLGITLMLFLVAGVVASGFGLASAAVAGSAVKANSATAVNSPVTIRATDDPAGSNVVSTSVARSAFVSPVSVSATGNTNAVVSTGVGKVVPILKDSVRAGVSPGAAGTVPNVKNVQLQAAGPAVYVKATAVKRFWGFIRVPESWNIGTKVVELEFTDTETSQVSKARVKEAATVQVSGYNVAVKSAKSVDDIELEVSATN